MEKSPEIVTEPIVCETIRKGQKSALDTFATEVVCSKAFKQRFGEVLMGACLNIVGC